MAKTHAYHLSFWDGLKILIVCFRESGFLTKLKMRNRDIVKNDGLKSNGVIF